MSEFANFWGWPFGKYTDRERARACQYVRACMHVARFAFTHQFKTLKGEYRLIYHIILMLGSCIVLTLFLRLYVSVWNSRSVRITG